MIDITSKPPTQDALAEKRREATASKTAIARRRRIAIWATVIVVLLTLTGIWVITGSMAEVAISDVIAGAGAEVAISDVIAGAGAGAIVGIVAIVGAIVGAVAGAVAGFMAEVAISEVIAMAMAGAVATAMAGAGAVVAAGVVAGYVVVVGASAMILFVIYDTHLHNQLDQADKKLSALTELNADEYPDECIEYDSLRSNDPTVKQYHAGIVSLGRKPVIAELDAAKAWIDSADQRDKTNKAHQACERMMEA